MLFACVSFGVLCGFGGVVFFCVWVFFCFVCLFGVFFVFLFVGFFLLF